MSVLDLLVSLDAHRKLQAILNVSLVAATGLLALVPSVKIGGRFAFLKRPGLFLAFMAVALFACRDPGLLPGAPRSRRSADDRAGDHVRDPSGAVARRYGGTVGPLNIYPLLWCLPLGLQPTYPTSRLFELLLMLGMLIFLYGAARRVAGELAARLALLPTFTFLALTAYGGFIHYSTEEVSVFLIACVGLPADGLAPKARLFSFMRNARLDPRPAAVRESQSILPVGFSVSPPSDCSGSVRA